MISPIILESGVKHVATVREFVYSSYRLISAQNPTVPLHGSDQNTGIETLNRLLGSYASTGLLITIAKTVSVPLVASQSEVIAGPATYLPTPEITEGRIANFESAWLELDGVRYPLIDKSRDVFNASWLFDPLVGLPRFVIVFNETEITRLRLYPAASQAYTFNVRAKFQLSELTANDDMSLVPLYMHRYLWLALAKDVAMMTSRQEAWTPRYEQMLVDERKNIEAASETNLSITGDNANLLNGYYRVEAGI